MADDDLPAPLRAYLGLVRLHEAVGFLVVLAYAVGALVIGSKLGQEIGAVLLILCLAVAVRVIRRRFVKPS